MRAWPPAAEPEQGRELKQRRELEQQRERRQPQLSAARSSAAGEDAESGRQRGAKGGWTSRRSHDFATTTGCSSCEEVDTRP
mmetsp:Transcript_4843/g.15734  ORF Transcript_4843/g.15734 Transcript_4843/m.15734 type:complete len:82 (-) Transcript_4843:10-255(-)